MTLLERAKLALGMGTKEKRNRKQVYEKSSGRTQVLLRELKSYVDEKPRPRKRKKRNPRNTGTLGRFARSGR